MRCVREQLEECPGILRPAPLARPEQLFGTNELFGQRLSIMALKEIGPWGDLLRSLPHIKTEVKLNFQANSESNSK